MRLGLKEGDIIDKSVLLSGIREDEFLRALNKAGGIYRRRTQDAKASGRLSGKKGIWRRDNFAGYGKT